MHRIAFFLPNFNGGGAERILILLASDFSLAGYNVDMIVGNSNGPFKNEISPLIQIVDLQEQRVSRCIPKLIKYLKTVKPCTLVSTLFRANIICIISHLISRSPSKLVIREASSTHYISRSQTINLFEIARDRIISEIYKFLYRHLYHLADIIITPSYSVRAHLTQVVNNKRAHISIISNPIDIELIRSLSTSDYIPLPLNVNKRYLFITVGRLEKEKGHSILLRAFRNVAMKHPDSSLIILGEGSERERLSRLASSLQIKDSVYMPGFIPNPFPYMKIAYAYIQSSLIEGFPNSLVQALSLGTKIIATNCGGTRDILENGLLGTIIPTDDVESLTNAMLESINHPVVLDSQTIDIALEKYEKKTILTEYIKVIAP